MWRLAAGRKAERDARIAAARTIHGGGGAAMRAAAMRAMDRALAAMRRRSRVTIAMAQAGLRVEELAPLIRLVRAGSSRVVPNIGPPLPRKASKVMRAQCYTLREITAMDFNTAEVAALPRMIDVDARTPMHRGAMPNPPPRDNWCARLFAGHDRCKPASSTFVSQIGVPLFNRRKRDETPPTPPTGMLPAGLGENSDETGVGAAYANPDTPMGTRDSGLGVPPFRPAPAKDAPAMSRPPLSPSSITPPVPPGGAPRPGAMPPARPVSRDPSDRRTLVVGRGISVQGTILDAERLVVEGTVEATMLQAMELSITQGGVFKGVVEVEDVEIGGTIDGTVTARGSLIVRATGRVLGTARCRRLQVEDGGQITGNIEMITEQARAEAAPRQPVEASD